MSAIDLQPESVPAPDAPVQNEADARCDAKGKVAHHFATAGQQYDAAKLGMWLFLATEVLLFGGLFVVYAVLRNSRPEIFHYGAQFLDARLGAVNTSVLIISSFTMATAVYAAQRGAWRLLITCLLTTFVCGAGFLAIKYVEYSHKIHEGLVMGVDFYRSPEWLDATPTDVAASPATLAAAPTAAGSTSAPAVTATSVAAGDAAKGRVIWDATCRTCHGANGEGMPNSGKPLAGSKFLAEQSDSQLLKFLKVGRAPTDPLNTTGIQMPPKGGNPLLKDQDLANVIAFVRTLPTASGSAAPTTSTATVVTDAAATAPAPTTASAQPAAEPEPLWIPKSSIPLGPPGPDGLSGNDTATQGPQSLEEAIFAHHSADPSRPANAHQFFAIYYLMTGLHGIHVLVGMLVVAGLTVMALFGRFGPRCFTAVDLGGLYWHLVDLIWIFLFPLFYLL